MNTYNLFCFYIEQQQNVIKNVLKINTNFNH